MFVCRGEVEMRDEEDSGADFDVEAKLDKESSCAVIVRVDEVEEELRRSLPLLLVEAPVFECEDVTAFVNALKEHPGVSFVDTDGGRFWIAQGMMR